MKRIFTPLLALSFWLMASPASADEASAHNSLVIIVDGSGSMGDNMQVDNGYIKKMDAAKQSLKEVLRKVKNDTWVAIFVFDGHGEGWAYKLAPVNLPVMDQAIDRIRNGGGTPLGFSIKHGADLLMHSRREQHGYGNYQLLIVTDGEASDNSDMLNFADEVRARDIRIDTIGVAMPGGGQHSLAKLSDSYQSADNLKELALALKKAVTVETTDGKAGQADYDLLKGLSHKVAVAFLKGLTRAAPNHPIGTEAPRPSPAKTTPAPGQSKSATPQPPVDPYQVKKKGCNAGWTSQSSGLATIALMLVFLFLMMRLRTREPRRVRIKKDSH